MTNEDKYLYIPIISFTILTLVLIALKVIGVSISWFVVFAPIWVLITCCITVCVVWATIAFCLIVCVGMGLITIAFISLIAVIVNTLVEELT